MRGRHQPELLADFVSTDDRQAWAKQPDSSMFFLGERAGTSAVRENAHDDAFLCPVPACQAPEFDLVAGTVKRHFFRHRAGSSGRTGHSGESAFHVAGKHLIARWAWAQGAHAEVEAGLPGSSRRPDVLVTTTESGQTARIAFEVQYSDIGLAGPKSLTARRGDFAALGASDVWLFGHTGAHMKPVRRATGDTETQDRVHLSPAQLQVAQSGQPVRWINPVEEIIATAVVEGHEVTGAPADWWRHPLRFGPRHPGTGDPLAVLHLDRLDDCELTGTGMVTPADKWLAGERERIDGLAARAQADHERRVLAAAARDAEAKARRREPVPTPAVPPDRPTAPRSSPGPLTPAIPVMLWHEQTPPAWDDHPLKDALEQAYGSVPAVIDDPLPTDNGVDCDHRLWHATVYARLVHGNQGSSFNTGQVIEALFQDRYPHQAANRMHDAGVAYLEVLADAGWLVRLPHVLRRDGGRHRQETDSRLSELAPRSSEERPCLPVAP